jgi:Xaa-Pro dipeptidase
LSSASLDALYLDHVADLERRYAGVLSTEGWDAVIIHSGSLVKRSQFDDQFWPLRASPHFAHWLPLVEPECAVVFRPGRRPRLVRTTTLSFWEMPAEPESRAFLDALDLVEVREAAAIPEQVGAGRVAFVGEDARKAAAWGIAAEHACPSSMVKAFDALRTTKTPYEVACIAEANRRARAGHEALRSAFGAGDASELDLHLLFLGATAQDDWETPYKNIVALGSHAATLHHVAYGRQSRQVESLLVDAGATCRGYASDITRTWTKGTGAAANTFAQLVAEVDAMQQRLCEAVRVGMPYEELHDESHRQLATVFREVGLVRGASD